jgi:hypothetical protein
MKSKKIDHHVLEITLKDGSTVTTTSHSGKHAMSFAELSNPLHTFKDDKGIAHTVSEIVHVEFYDPDQT